MGISATKIQTIYQDVLANYLISMARTVESSVESALEALLHPNLEEAASLSSKVFLAEPRVNEMEILIDDHAVRMLRTGLLDDEEIRRVVASQKIANDLERIGDLAVNVSERVISLAGMTVTEAPRDLEPMAGAVRGMLGRMNEAPGQAAPQLQFLLATRYLERIADHATNIAEDIIFWVRGLDVRHSRTRIAVEEADYPEKRS
jgi:phosphate transport system protein